MYTNSQSPGLYIRVPFCVGKCSYCDFCYTDDAVIILVWINTLKKALSCSPEHFSCYQLTIKEGTPFFKRRAKVEFTFKMEEEASFLLTSDLLEENGYIHYEVSNFAKAEGLYLFHNLKYWQHVTCLGLGPSAHSFIDDMRWWNFSSVRRYLNLIRAVSSLMKKRK